MAIQKQSGAISHEHARALMERMEDGKALKLSSEDRKWIASAISRCMLTAFPPRL